jgi:hypothetical protein
VRGG